VCARSIVSDCLTDIRQNLAAPRLVGKQDNVAKLAELLSNMQGSVVEQIKSVLNNLQVSFFFNSFASKFITLLSEMKEERMVVLRLHTPKLIRGGWLHYTDTSKPVVGYGAQNIVTVQSGFRTSDLSITAPKR
jgi:hypothetical protein